MEHLTFNDIKGLSTCDADTLTKNLYTIFRDPVSANRYIKNVYHTLIEIDSAFENGDSLPALFVTQSDLDVVVDMCESINAHNGKCSCEGDPANDYEGEYYYHKNMISEYVFGKTLALKTSTSDARRKQIVLTIGNDIVLYSRIIGEIQRARAMYLSQIRAYDACVTQFNVKGYNDPKKVKTLTKNERDLMTSIENTMYNSKAMADNEIVVLRSLSEQRKAIVEEIERCTSRIINSVEYAYTERKGCQLVSVDGDENITNIDDVYDESTSKDIVPALDDIDDSLVESAEVEYDQELAKEAGVATEESVSGSEESK